jgi:hypothetical protein
MEMAGLLFPSPAADLLRSSYGYVQPGDVSRNTNVFECGVRRDIFGNVTSRTERIPEMHHQGSGEIKLRPSFGCECMTPIWPTSGLLGDILTARLRSSMSPFHPASRVQNRRSTVLESGMFRCPTERKIHSP